MENLNLNELELINGGKVSGCDVGVALSAIYGGAAGAAFGGPAGIIAGAVVGALWIPVGAACPQ